MTTGRRMTTPKHPARTRTPGRVVGIVLAAGASTRMGTPKALLPLDGAPLLRHVVEGALHSEALDALLVVLGHEADRIEAALAHSGEGDGGVRSDVRDPRRAELHIVRARRWRAGQSASLRAGLRAAARWLDAQGGPGPAAPAAALILLGDEPDLPEGAIDRVVRVWRAGAGPVVRAVYGEERGSGAGVPGHPVLLDRAIWPRVIRTRGDEGARGILACHPEWVTAVALPGPRPLAIETPEDYRRLLSLRRARGERSPGRKSIAE